MGVRATADYVFSIISSKAFPLNNDQSTVVPLDGAAGGVVPISGGAGTFDVTGSSDPSGASIPMTVKIGTSAETKNIDISAAVSLSAITLTELATALTTAAFTNITVATTNDIITLTVTTPGTELYLQVYGEMAEITLFGQGAGMQAIAIDTQKTISRTPNLKDAESFTTVDSKGLETEVISDAYLKGFNMEFVDSAMDYVLKALLEGGVYTVSDTFYAHPTSESTKKYFALEVVRAKYKKGINKQADLVGYILERYITCVADIGDDTGDRNFADQKYNMVATSYKDPYTAVISSSLTEKQFTKAQWAVLDYGNI